MTKVTLEEWVRKYAPLRLKEVREFPRSVHFVFEGKSNTLWEVVVGVYGEMFCVSAECYSLLVEDRIQRCEVIPNKEVKE